MPKIKTVTAQVAVQAPGAARRATADDFGGGAGLIAAGEGLTQFADFLQEKQERNELSEVRKTLSSGRAQHTQYMIDSAQTMEEGGAGFTQDVTAQMKDWGERTRSNFKTEAAQRAFDEGFAAMNGDLTTRAVGVQAKAFAAKQVFDFNEGLNSDRHTVSLDPTQLEGTLKNRLAAIAVMNIGEDRKAELSTQAENDLTISAVRGNIRQDPEGTIALLESGHFKDTIDPDDVKTLLSEAKTRERANRADLNLAKLQKEEAIAAEQQTVMDGFLTSAYTDGLATAEVLDKGEVLNVTQREHFLRLAEARSKGEVDFNKTTPEVFLNLKDRIFLPDGDPRKLVDETEIVSEIGRRLSREDGDYLRNQIRGLRTPVDTAEAAEEKQFQGDVDRYLKGIRNTLEKTTFSKQDPIGAQSFYKHELEVRRHLDKIRAEGGDYRSFLDPTSKDYLGTAAIAAQRSPMDVALDRSRSFRNIPVSTRPQRIEGETFQEYRERTGQ